MPHTNRITQNNPVRRQTVLSLYDLTEDVVEVDRVDLLLHVDAHLASTERRYVRKNIAEQLRVLERRGIIVRWNDVPTGRSFVKVIVRTALRRQARVNA